jgi:hypothetical protein
MIRNTRVVSDQRDKKRTSKLDTNPVQTESNRIASELIASFRERKHRTVQLQSRLLKDSRH